MAKKKIKEFDFTEQMEQDATAPEISDDALGQVAALAKQQLGLADEVVEAEEALKDVRTRLASVQEDLLPQTMLGLGISEFKLDTGEKVTIKSDIHISFSAENTSKALAWFRKNKAGDLIKTEVVAKYGKGEDKDAKELVKQLKREGVDFKSAQGIHAQTLKAFARENEAKAIDDKTRLTFPESIFSIWPSNKAQIKQTKSK